jgi:hypothetical protein
MTREDNTTPWWRVGIVWLVVGGPLTVVIASIATIVIAVSGADELVNTDTASAKPAIQARNQGPGKQ